MSGKGQEKKKTEKKRRANAAHYFERSHSKNMLRKAIRILKREMKYQRYLVRKGEKAKKAGWKPTEQMSNDFKKRLDMRGNNALHFALACAEKHQVIGKFRDTWPKEVPKLKLA